jgi:hypothetical protein
VSQSDPKRSLEVRCSVSVEPCPDFHPTAIWIVTVSGEIMASVPPGDVRPFKCEPPLGRQGHFGAGQVHCSSAEWARVLSSGDTKTGRLSPSAMAAALYLPQTRSSRRTRSTSHTSKANQLDKREERSLAKLHSAQQPYALVPRALAMSPRVALSASLTCTPPIPIKAPSVAASATF